MRPRGPRTPDSLSAAQTRSAGQDRLEAQARAQSLTARRRDAGGRRRGDPLRLAHGQGGAGESGAADPTSVRHRERGAPPGRGRPGAGRRDRARAPGRDRAPARTRCRAQRTAGRSRSPALARARRARARRHRARARPDHRPAQCRRHPAHRGGLRGGGGGHHRAAQPGGDRRAGEIRLRRARICAHRHGAESRPRARASCASADTSWSASTARETSTSATRRCARRSRWCWARRARDCGN